MVLPVDDKKKKKKHHSLGRGSTTSKTKFGSYRDSVQWWSFSIFFLDIYSFLEIFDFTYYCHPVCLVLMVCYMLIYIFEMLRLSLLEILIVNDFNACIFCVASLTKRWVPLSHILITIFTNIWFDLLRRNRLGHKWKQFAIPTETTSKLTVKREET